MTKLEFKAICNELTIEPNIALENDELCEALKERNDDEVKRILKTEF